MQQTKPDKHLMEHIRTQFPNWSEREVEEHAQHYINVVRLLLELSELPDEDS